MTCTDCKTTNAVVWLETSEGRFASWTAARQVEEPVSRR